MFRPESNTNITIKRSNVLTDVKKATAGKLSLRLALKQQQMQRIIDERKSKPEVKGRVSKQKSFLSKSIGCADAIVGSC